MGNVMNSFSPTVNSIAAHNVTLLDSSSDEYNVTIPGTVSLVMGDMDHDVNFGIYALCVMSGCAFVCLMISV